MDYQKHYNNLMNTRILLKKERYELKKQGQYFEGHHILPKYLGGKGTSHNGVNHANIVFLTAREHFLAHWLFWKIKRDRQSALAFHKMMSNNKNQNRKLSSRGYEEAKLAFSITNKGNDYWKHVKNRPKITPERKLAQSIAMKGRHTGEKNPFFGKKHDQESRRKISEKTKKRDVEKFANYKGFKLVYLNGVFVAEFKRSKDIAEFIGSSHSNVRHVLGGKQKTAKGYNIYYKNQVQ